MNCRSMLVPSLVLFLSTFLVQTASAVSLSVGEGLFLQVDLPAGWQVSDSPPATLTAEMAEHLGHEAAGKGQTPTEEQLLEAAAKRLAANEAFVCRTQTGACLVIDFSPLLPGEAAAGSAEVERSARYAAAGMESEEAVAVLSSETASINLPGADAAHRLEVDYRHHDRPMKFLGIVGFADPYWFYLYYTDPLADPRDLTAARGMLKTLNLRRQP